MRQFACTNSLDKLNTRKYTATKSNSMERYIHATKGSNYTDKHKKALIPSGDERRLGGCWNWEREGEAKE